MKFTTSLGLLGLLALATPAYAGTGFFDLPVLQPNPQPGQRYTPNDLNGDGTSDLLWFNPATNQFGYWLISLGSDGHFHRGLSRIFTTTPGYFVGAVGDFNNDGRADLVWTSDHRDLYLWTASGTGFHSSLIGGYAAGWKLLGAGDIDGDGNPDLLWWNDSTNQFAYWLMRGGNRVGARTFNIAPGYQLSAIGYDGSRSRLSLIWVNPEGEVYSWDSTGTGFRSNWAGNFARAGEAWHIEWVDYPSGTSDIQFTTTNAANTSVEGYYWTRQLDAQGNQIAGHLGNAWGGGWGGHISGQLYYHWRGSSAMPVQVLTDRTGTAGFPQALAINSVFEPPGGVNAWADIFTGFPENWYIIGERWYRSDLTQYQATPRP